MITRRPSGMVTPCWACCLRWLARGCAAKIYKRGDRGLPCTFDRSGKLDDCQPLKAAVAEVFWSIMLTHLQARSPNPMLDMQSSTVQGNSLSTLANCCAFGPISDVRPFLQQVCWAQIQTHESKTLKHRSRAVYCPSDYSGSVKRFAWTRRADRRLPN